MPKRIVLYILLGVIAGVVLTLLAVGILKQPPKPAVAPPEAKIEEPALPVETTAAEVTTTVKEKAVHYRLQKPAVQKGMTYVAWTPSGYSNANSVSSMEQMASLGIEWVALVTTWYQDKFDSTEISPAKYKTPSDESLIFAIRKLHDLKIKVMLKPHLDIVNGEGKWRADISCISPENWQAWFDSYTAFIMQYAQIAAKEDVEIFCIGTELCKVSVNQPDFWKGLIKKIREVYKGQLTYAANWYEEYDKITFWSELDYAGVDPYFPLVGSLKPNVEQIKDAWKDWLKMLEPWQKSINKPVIFTEIGYKSSVGATDEPWQHTPSGDLDLQLQADSYQALLETFWDKPWFYGVYWWFWGAHPKMGGELNRNFTPQNKPAQEVVKEWYNKPISQKTY
jgi:hypothetical protein